MTDSSKKENIIEVFREGDFSEWLSKKGDTENHVLVVLHKKHTGKMHTNAASLMREAISFGWIDTTSKKIDEDRWAINYRKRNKNSKWSYNTLRYAEELIKEGKMSSAGLRAFEEGKKKLPHDYGIPDNPDIPSELERELNKVKNREAKENFEKFSPSVKRTYYRWLLRAKLPETKNKRIEQIIKRALISEKPGTLSTIND